MLEIMLPCHDQVPEEQPLVSIPDHQQHLHEIFLFLWQLQMERKKSQGKSYVST